MKKLKFLCLVCGNEVEAPEIEDTDVGKILPDMDPYSNIIPEDVGIWDTTCDECGYYYPGDQVEEIISGDIDGFVVQLDYGKDVRHYIYSTILQCEEARRAAKKAIEKSTFRPGSAAVPRSVPRIFKERRLSMLKQTVNANTTEEVKNFITEYLNTHRPPGLFVTSADEETSLLAIREDILKPITKQDDISINNTPLYHYSTHGTRDFTVAQSSRHTVTFSLSSTNNKPGYRFFTCRNVTPKDAKDVINEILTYYRQLTVTIHQIN